MPLTSLSFGMLAAPASGYPTYSIAAAGGAFSAATNDGVAQVGSATSYRVVLDLAPGSYTLLWDAGDGSAPEVDDVIVAATSSSAPTVEDIWAGAPATFDANIVSVDPPLLDDEPFLSLADIQGELTTRGLTASWAAKVIKGARWLVNRKARVGLTSTSARFDLYDDAGTAVASTQAVTDDGSGNQAVGAAT